MLPEFFHLVIGTEDAWHTDRDGGDWIGGGDCALFLDFQVFEGQVEMPHALAAYEDISRVFDRVRKVVSPRIWKRLGIHYMVQYLTQFMEEGRQPDGDPTVRPFLYDKRDPYRTPPKAATEWLERLQDHASEAYAQARDLPTPQRKRVKITDDHLREVAEVYRHADNVGEPPTRSVARHFRAPHSTAAKWVATARRKKFLPAAGTTPVWGPYGEPGSERVAELKEILTDQDGPKLSPLQRKMLEDELKSLGGVLPE
jgi:hypothetical protein